MSYLVLRDSQNLIGQVAKIRYSGTEEVSPQVSSCDSQTGQGVLLQQEQQYDSMETYRQSYLSSAARVIKKISMKKTVGGHKAVYGVASVDDELFVLLSGDNSQVAVYSINDYQLVRHLNVPGLKPHDYTDI